MPYPIHVNYNISYVTYITFKAKRNNLNRLLRWVPNNVQSQFRTGTF